MKTLYIVRHAQTIWNTEKRMQGIMDSPLTEVGKIQAKKLGTALQEIAFDKIYVSPLKRAVHTAELIMGSKNYEMQTDDRLKEIKLGCWEGFTTSEIEVENPIDYKCFFDTPHLFQKEGFETFESVTKRAHSFIKDIIQNEDEQTVLIVSHAVTVRAMLSFWNQRTLEDFWKGDLIHSTSLNQIVIDDRHNGAIKIYNDITHLEQ